jgi:hypothetical protein
MPASRGRQRINKQASEYTGCQNEKSRNPWPKKTLPVMPNFRIFLFGKENKQKWKFVPISILISVGFEHEISNDKSNYCNDQCLVKGFKMASIIFSVVC